MAKNGTQGHSAKKQADLNVTAAEFDQRVAEIAKELMQRDNCIIGFRYSIKPAEIETVRGGHSGVTRPLTAADIASVQGALAE